MKEYGGIVRAVTAWLNEREIPARGGWSGEERIAEDRPIVMVSVKSYAAAHGGFSLLVHPSELVILFDCDRTLHFLPCLLNRNSIRDGGIHSNSTRP